ncbi:MAG TPA: hypothetical protein PLH07_03350 [Sulfurovum sp.]|nr:MAG: hypothetical protein B7Y63_09330 [Sulfurovum sp. 35-42-20]OYZ26838.1 MAG: hypothetical protein B7Y23_00450 [Sulfurovum sp. 16-42-52]OYZ49926.1 MAG: hypothetical protein B7Y13_02990 [Sulfurovum sp. 24-42-9]OZA46650.1 MAG: hypothetical protein B7X80_01490 [Sulfurovum sp. 17-42-90]HQT28318.1 hypothetical protein [Sulfurovum sp.]
MIAYNHYIKFIPRLEDDKESVDSFVGQVKVRESSLFASELKKKLQCEMIFPESQGRDLGLYSDREFMDRGTGQIWVFEVKDVITFFWSSGMMELEYIKHENFTEELLKYWALHVVLPIFFIIEGIYDFLHAGAVEINEEPVLFIAESFGGKSTMTDYFMKQGHTMISDDKVATFQKDGDFYTVSSYPYHRPYRDIEDLGFFVENFAKTPKAMHSIYVLQKVEGDNDVKVSMLTGVDKFMALRSAKEMNLFFPESKQLDYLGEIAQRLSVYKVTVPWDFNRLNEVYNTILEHHSSFRKMK